jgi:predicted HTH domain antitoxin
MTDIDDYIQNSIQSAMAAGYAQGVEATESRAVKRIDELEEEVRRLKECTVANLLELVERGEISTGKVAELLGVNYADIMDFSRLRGEVKALRDFGRKYRDHSGSCSEWSGHEIRELCEACKEWEELDV